MDFLLFAAILAGAIAFGYAILDACTGAAKRSTDRWAKDQPPRERPPVELDTTAYATRKILSNNGGWGSRQPPY